MKHPNRFLSLLTSLALLSAAAATAATFEQPGQFPESVTYRGHAVDEGDRPLNGSFEIVVQVLSADASQVLATEKHETVIRDGRFTIEVGSRSTFDGQKPGLHSVFAKHPEVLLQVSIDGERQFPNVVVQPSGHSPASIAALSGSEGGKEPGTKAYRAVGSGTGVQAVTLRSKLQLNEESTPTQRKRPLEITVTDLGVSRAVRDLPTISASSAGDVADRAEEVNRPRHGDLTDENGDRFGTTTRKIQDPLVEQSRNQAGATRGTPSEILNFAGVGNVSGVLPPDTDGAVGPNHYVQVVNLAFNIYDKTGVSVLVGGNPVNTNTLWAGFGGLCQNDNNGDAIFLYDQHADRWVLTQFTSGDVVCFAVSTTNDPTGTFRLFQINTARFPDYYKVGVWPAADNNAYFLTTNSGFQNRYDVYAIDRESMISPALPARPAQLFQNFPNLFMPADVDGATPPADDEPGILYTFLDGGEPYFGSPPEDSIELYEFDVDWVTPANSTFGQAQNFTPTSGGLAAFNWSVCGFFVSNCLPQPGTAQGIDSASWWPMQRFVYRKFPGYEALVGTWTVDVTGSPDLAAPRWFELRRPLAPRRGAVWSIYQQGTHSPDSEHRFMPSIGMDGRGNIALGYSVTSSTTFPSIRYSVHESGSALGSMQPEHELIAGGGSQTHSAARWGDYASMELDPSDDCTFWFTTEYLAATGSAPWITRVGTFKVPGCGFIAADPNSFEVCSTTSSVASTITLLEAFQGTTNLSLSGCPAGASCSLDDTTLVFPSTTTTLNIDNIGSASTGEYSIVVTGTDSVDGALTGDAPVGLSVFTTSPSVPTLTVPANGSDFVPGDPVTFSWTAADATSYTIQIATDPGFANVVDSATVNSNTYATSLPSTSTFYWRVRAANVCGQTEYSATFDFTTAPLPGDCPAGVATEILFTDDLEGGDLGWTHTGGTQNTWQLSSGRTHSGTNAYWAEDVNSVSDQYLVSPTIAIPSPGNAPVLRFWNHQTIEDISVTFCYDGAVLEISNNSGASWVRLESELATDPYDGAVSTEFGNPLGGENAWCGDQDWLESVVDLAAYAGDSVQFRFRLATDNVVGREGWYVDDIVVQTCSSTGIFDDDFESGDTSAWIP